VLGLAVRVLELEHDRLTVRGCRAEGSEADASGNASPIDSRHRSTTSSRRPGSILDDRVDVREQPMFGGLTFMVAGRMWCGVARDELIVRLDPDREADALAQPHARPMDFTGRPMRGFVHRATGRPERRTAEPTGARSLPRAEFAASEMRRPVSLAEARS
jgi:hypothetical protein